MKLLKGSDSSYLIGLLAGFLWAALIAHFVDVGPPRYAKTYSADTLCGRIKRGMHIDEVNKISSSLGEPHSTALLSERLMVEGTDTMCIVQLDSMRSVVEQTKVSNSLVVE